MSANDLPDDLFRARRLRPYLITGGRTRASVDLAMETQIRSTPQGTASLAQLDHEREALVRMCVTPMPVAEIAGRLHLPLQVARVVVSDLVVQGLVAVDGPISPDRPDLHLLERVLEGLRTL